MTGLRDSDAWTGYDTWTGYQAALGALHAARDATASSIRAARLEAGRRAAQMTQLDTQLTEQQDALLALAAELRVRLTAADLSPVDVPACYPAEAVAEVQARLRATDAALAETRRVAALPRLLPAWPGTFARACVIYAGFAVPSLLLTVGLSLSGVHGNLAVLVGFAVVWPALAALLGGAAVGYLSAPRLAAAPTSAAPTSTATAAGGRLRRHRWLGIVLAWASWLVPGALLDWAGSLWPG